MDDEYYCSFPSDPATVSCEMKDNYSNMGQFCACKDGSPSLESPPPVDSPPPESPPPDNSPPPKSDGITWIFGRPGHNCNDECAYIQKTCSVEDIKAVTNQAILQEVCEAYE